MGKADTYCTNFGCVDRPNGCWTYQARADFWSRISTTKHIEGQIWPQDQSDAWGLVMNKENHLEFTKDGQHFNHISFEGKCFVLTLDKSKCSA